MHIVSRRSMLALPVERLVGNSHNSHTSHHHHMSRATTMSPDSSASDSSSEHTLSPCSYTTKLSMMMSNNNNVSSSTNPTCTQTNSITSSCSHVISSTTPTPTPIFEGDNRENEDRVSFPSSPRSTPESASASTSPAPTNLNLQQAKANSTENGNFGVAVVKLEEEDKDEVRISCNNEGFECKQEKDSRSSCCDKNCAEDNKTAGSGSGSSSMTEEINNQQSKRQGKDVLPGDNDRGRKTPTRFNENTDHNNSIEEHEDDSRNGFPLVHQHHHHQNQHHHYNGSEDGDEKGRPPSRPPSTTSTISSTCFNISSLIMNRPQVHSLRFSIDDILRPDFGKTAKNQIASPTGSISSSCKSLDIKPTKDRSRTVARSASVKSSNSSTSNERPSRPSSVKNHSEDSNSSCNSRSTEVVDETKVNPKVPQGPLLWPAWVYCTRYSDRPSSGPRSRRIRKAEGEPKIPSEQPEEKRPRTAFTAEQLARLKQEFEENRYLTEKRRQDLARDLKLHENQIKIWFQNKRAKLKKSTGTRGGLAIQLMAQGLYNHSTVPIDEDEDYLLLPP